MENEVDDDDEGFWAIRFEGWGRAFFFFSGGGGGSGFLEKKGNVETLNPITL